MRRSRYPTDQVQRHRLMRCRFVTTSASARLKAIAPSLVISNCWRATFSSAASLATARARGRPREREREHWLLVAMVEMQLA
jgi:hypothetical protein